MLRRMLWRMLALAVLAAGAVPAHAAEAYQVFTISGLLAGGYDGDTRFTHRLISRRMMDVYNSTGDHLPQLRQKCPYSPAFMHPQDLERLGVSPGTLIRIESDHSFICAVAATSRGVLPGVISIFFGVIVFIFPKILNYLVGIYLLLLGFWWIFGVSGTVFAGIITLVFGAVVITIISLLMLLIIARVVAETGLIGFVGLVVPHLVRLLWGSDYRRLTPLAILLGAGGLLLADIAARVVIAPQELPVGVVTELVEGDVYHWGALMAGALLGSLPVAIMYSFFVEYYVSGMTGAVKE